MRGQVDRLYPASRPASPARIPYVVHREASGHHRGTQPGRRIDRDAVVAQFDIERRRAAWPARAARPSTARPQPPGPPSHRAARSRPAPRHSRRRSPGSAACRSCGTAPRTAPARCRAAITRAPGAARQETPVAGPAGVGAPQPRTTGPATGRSSWCAGRSRRRGGSGRSPGAASARRRRGGARARAGGGLARARLPGPRRAASRRASRSRRLASWAASWRRRAAGFLSPRRLARSAVAAASCRSSAASASCCASSAAASAGGRGVRRRRARRRGGRGRPRSRLIRPARSRARPCSTARRAAPDRAGPGRRAGSPWGRARAARCSRQQGGEGGKLRPRGGPGWRGPAGRGRRSGPRRRGWRPWPRAALSRPRDGPWRAWRLARRRRQRGRRRRGGRRGRRGGPASVRSSWRWAPAPGEAAAWVCGQCGERRGRGGSSSFLLSIRLGGALGEGGPGSSAGRGVPPHPAGSPGKRAEQAEGGAA